jgi:hypothetical protein
MMLMRTSNMHMYEYMNDIRIYMCVRAEMREGGQSPMPRGWGSQHGSGQGRSEEVALSQNRRRLVNTSVKQISQGWKETWLCVLANQQKLGLTHKSFKGFF